MRTAVCDFHTCADRRGSGRQAATCFEFFCGNLILQRPPPLVIEFAALSPRPLPQSLCQNSFGGASDVCWCKNRIAMALPAGVSVGSDPDLGCDQCAAMDCTQTCRDAGLGVDGYCANPGSTDPGSCCACVTP